jgi:molybdopterin synthase sulfur carrier subunit
MKIKIYAVLKEYFEPEIDLEGISLNITELKSVLLAINPSAKEILNLSRFAVNDVFVNIDHQISNDETISIIPPSSGG